MKKFPFLKTTMLAAMLAACAMPIHADGVKWLEKCLDKSKIATNRGTLTIDAANKTLKVSGTSNQEIKLTLKPGENMSMNNGQTFVVVEANTTFDKTKKLDHLTIDAKNSLINKTGSLLGFNKTVNGHQLTVFCILDKRGSNAGDQTAVDNMIDYLYDNATYNSTEASFYLRPSKALENNADIEIYNIGFYSLGDILTEYEDLAKESWKFTKSQYGELASYNGDNNCKVKIDQANGTTTLKYNYLRARSLTNMPSSYTRMDLLNMNLADDQVTPLKKDAFDGLSFNEFILLNKEQYKLFPTMNQYVAYPNATYHAYKDGVRPSDIHVVTYGNKGDKTSSYTRNFKKGNNSCVLPFDINVSELPEGLKVYTFDSYENSQVNFKEGTETLKAGTPMMIQAEEEGMYMISAAATPNLLSDISGYKESKDKHGNKFVGSFVKETPVGYTNLYALDKEASAFVKMGEAKTTYYRAFLSLANEVNAVRFSVSFGGNTTGISHVPTTGKADGAYYNLQGVKMNPENLPHGIYIHNGKKVIK